MKKLLTSLFIISAIYWSPPSFRFNIVQAAEPVETNQKKDAVQASQAWLIETYLKSGLSYVEGLERQVKSEYPLSIPEVRRQLETYGREAMQDLKSAKSHLQQYQTTLARKPASTAESRKRGHTHEDHVVDVRSKLDSAISLNEKLWSRLSDGNAMDEASKDQLREQASQLRGEIKSAMFMAREIEP